MSPEPSLVDRSYTGRHLRHLPEARASKPSKAALMDLFVAKSGEQVPCDSSTFLFAAYAQWFTDSFLRTSHGMVFDDDGNALRDNHRLVREENRHRRNDSNHEIDLNQIYGTNEEKTRLLRRRCRFAPYEQGRERGYLDYQIRSGQMYPPKLLSAPIEPPKDVGKPWPKLNIRREFEGLHHEPTLREIVRRGKPERSIELFAVGLEHGNSTIGNSVFNTLFLREHNRVAKLIGDANPHWDDEQVFQTTRNTVMVIALNTVLTDYIRHISQRNFPIDIIPGFADKKSWYRSNRISIEFNLLYRWHELVPESFDFLEDPADYRHNNVLLLDKGPELLIDALSKQRAGKLRLGNLPEHLSMVKADSIDLMRSAQIYTYNSYRERFGLPRAFSFKDVTKDPELLEKLKALYPDGIESLEWFVGLYAEDHGKPGIMGPLMLRMVAHDAFTQALTNPLLANGVYNTKTFSAVGMEEIEKRGSLFDLIRRNTDTSIDFRCSFSI